jgi:hypothetical protein
VGIKKAALRGLFLCVMGSYLLFVMGRSAGVLTSPAELPAPAGLWSAPTDGHKKGRAMRPFLLVVEAYLLFATM